MMMLKIRKFHAGDHIHSEQAAVTYLQVAMEEADKAENPRQGAAIIANALGEVARAQRHMSAIASDADRSRSGIYKALSNQGDPALSTVISAIHAAGGSLTVTMAR
ncbi:putative addiction module antidote protein [Bifidobacterium polysaccharolyticum]|uniref:Putative addiction module antidote protein n=2 Tax=Bifidobacterium TaxID=1678 RepID=A0A556R7W3_9BIFI|nr:putative addiction module antidote protein [Bifidobacterium polysaccharolyticum]